MLDLLLAKAVPLMEDRPGSRINFTSFLLLDAIFTTVVPCERRSFVIFVYVPDLPALHFSLFPGFTATPARRVFVKILAGDVLFRGRLLDGDLHGIRRGSAHNFLSSQNIDIFGVEFCVEIPSARETP